MVKGQDIFSVIDVGTNNVLLLIAKSDNNIYKPLVRKSAISALGKGMLNKKLTAEAILRAKKILEDFIIESRNWTDQIYVLGTSCSREATNINDLSQWLEKEFGITYNIISGDEEAHLNGLANIEEFPDQDHFILFDIGGGSTEFTYIKDKMIKQTISIDLGIRRLINQYQSHDDQINVIRHLLLELDGQFSTKAKLIGIGGTVTSIGAMKLNQKEYSGKAVHGLEIGKSFLIDLIQKVDNLPQETIKKMLPFEPGRADILITGLLIVKEILEYFNASDFLVSDRGIQFGYLKKLENKGQ